MVITDEATGAPMLILDADGFLRSVFFRRAPPDPRKHCHRPIMVAGSTPLDEVLYKLKQSKAGRHGAIERDAVLVWGPQPRIITGSDLFDRLLHGIR